MVYFHKEQLTEFTYADAERCTLKGYPGNVYKIEDKVDGSGESSAFISKHSLDEKTRSQAQTLVNQGITGLNNLMSDAELSSGTFTQGAITLE